MSAEGLPARLRSVAENLLTLEVNTIVSERIGTEKMPPPEHALIDIANEYRTWLSEHGNAQIWKTDELPEASQAIFVRIRTTANDLLHPAATASAPPAARTAGADKEDVHDLLERIKSNADQILAIFDRLNASGAAPVALRRAETNRQPLPVELLPEEIVSIRKIWEIMLDQVWMQTVIQLDGDVITRVRRGLENRADGPLVMQVHDKGIQTSTSSWSKLIEIIGGAIKGLAELFGGRT